MFVLLVMGTAMPHQQKTLREQIAMLSTAVVKRDDIDFEWLRANFSRGERVWKQRPELKVLVRFVFSSMGVDKPVAAVEDYISTYEHGFQEASRDVALADIRKTFDEKIPRGAQIRTAFGNLRDVYEDFHGQVYTDALIAAEGLGYYVIQHSIGEDRSPIGPARQTERKTA